MKAELAIQEAPVAPNVAVRAERNVVLDSLRVVLAAMVVALHGHFLQEVDRELSYFLENYLFRVAVPLFFLINGYYFAGALDRSTTAWKPWALRLLTLYAVWSLIYIYPIVAKGAATALTNLVFGYWHLWYLLGAAGASLVLYACRRLHSGALAGLLATTYLLGLAMQYAGNYHLFSGALDAALNYYPTYRNFLLFAFPLFGAGYLIARLRLADRVSAPSALLMVAAGLIALTLEFWANTRAGLDREQTFDILAALPLLCVGVFLLAQKGHGLLPQPRVDLAALSAAIFFVHVLVLRTLPFTGIKDPTPLVLATIAVSAATYPVLARLNRRWPVFL